MVTPDILTYSGSKFDFIEPHNNEFRIEDIAHALSHVCRFAGHTREFYSVAQHSVLASRIVTDGPQAQMAALMHDASEAYIGDITRPLKQLLPEYKVIEKRIEIALFNHFGIAYPLPESVKHADMVMLATEKRDLMPPADDEWKLITGVQPMTEVINPWHPEKAAREFLMRFEALGGVR